MVSDMVVVEDDVKWTIDTIVLFSAILSFVGVLFLMVVFLNAMAEEVVIKAILKCVVGVPLCFSTLFSMVVLYRDVDVLKVLFFRLKRYKFNNEVTYHIQFSNMIIGLLLISDYIYLLLL